ncbi:response regulator transcription factor [Edaphocola aurantiacus]|uniref:response regulator transcription factor n=1 Tax=Edaphocola aurantiacus TaxID=2601682 RepID=UPI001C9632CD|nr:response regulator transcription factor [Edaphocola aurantiacus]
MITVVIVEDQPDHQHLFKAIINKSQFFNCIGIYSNGKDAIEGIINTRPNAVIMDIGLPDMSGVECIRVLKPLVEDVKFMICTVFEDDASIFEALKAGADSYIVKESKSYQIIDALLAMHNGDMPISSCIATKLLSYLPKSDESSLQKQIEYSITDQEVTILELLAEGYCYQEIADKLKLKLHVLKRHIYNIFIKMKVKNRTTAINKYFSNKE